MLRLRVWLGLALLFGAVSAALMPPVARGGPLDFDLPDGHFYTQANGRGGAGGLGFALTDEDGIPFWSQFQRLGGVDAVGYPVSQRFLFKGFVTQALQKAVFQWQPQTGLVYYVNVLDELHLAGEDGWLLVERSVPRPIGLPYEDSLSWDEIVQERQGFLGDFPALRDRYFAPDDPLALFGLPVSHVEDMGNHYAVRLQRASLQQWKEDVPWASSGEVTVANGGDLAKEVGLFPLEAIAPGEAPAVPDPTAEPAADGGQSLVVVDAGHGGDQVGASHEFGDGVVLREKDLNLEVAQRTAELLRAEGYEVLLTRDEDVGLNPGGYDVNEDGVLDEDDDLQIRVDMANAAGAAVIVSIHHNGSNDAGVQGTEVYYNAGRPFSAADLELAEILLDELTSRLSEAGYSPLRRGIKEDLPSRGRELYLLGPAHTSRGITRPSQMPGVLGEGLFLSNGEDAWALRQPAILEAEAQAYAAAVERFLR